MIYQSGEVKIKSKFNSLDRSSKRKTETRKNNKNPPSLVVVDTEEAQTKQNSNVLTLSRKEKKKKLQVCYLFSPFTRRISLTLLN